MPEQNTVIPAAPDPTPRVGGPAAPTAPAATASAAKATTGTGTGIPDVTGTGTEPGLDPGAGCTACVGGSGAAGRQGWSRRSALAAAGLAVAATAAACSSGSDESPSSSTSEPGGSGGADGQAQLAAVSDIPDGGCLVSGKVLLARSGDTVVGHSSTCTHKGGTVAPDGADARCPLHGSVFNATTGAVVNGPATEPLPAVPVTVRSGGVFQA